MVCVSFFFVEHRHLTARRCWTGSLRIRCTTTTAVAVKGLQIASRGCRVAVEWRSTRDAYEVSAHLRFLWPTGAEE